MTGGLVSLALGGIVALAFREDEALLAGGVTSASFGAINAGLAFGLLDLGGRRAIATCARYQGSLDLDRELFEESTGQLRSATGFALNTGLDVAYIVAGALMFFVGQAGDDPSVDPGTPWMRGAGVASITQGLFLLAFDIALWRRSNRRAQAAGALLF